MSRRVDITGQRFGKLFVICGGGKIGAREAVIASCECGAGVRAAKHDLRAGDVTSCGCGRMGRNRGVATAHGHSANGSTSSTYRSWQAMKTRVRNPNHVRHARYHGRGISIDPRWSDFASFLADMGERPDGTSLDRIDNDMGYGPGNCRWATPKQQANNRANNRKAA